MINFTEGAHLYDKDGNPRHEAGLREARKEELLYSVTTIDKAAFPNPGIERYKMNKLAEVAALNPIQPHESAEDYANRIYGLSNEARDKASDFGTRLHDAIEHYPQLPLEPDLHPWLEKFGAWFDREIVSTEAHERILVDLDIGVAGKMDFRGVHRTHGEVVVDWKTANVKKKNGKKEWPVYDSWPRQLAFYAVADSKKSGTFPQVPTCISVVIDSNEPDDPFVKVWTPEEIKLAYRSFVYGAWLFHAGKPKGGFWPVGKWNPCEVPMID